MGHRDMNIPLHAMSKPALVEKCQELKDELDRARGGLADSMNRNASLKFDNTKLIRVQKKKKGVIDAKSKMIIKKAAWGSVMSNFIALGIAIPASMQSGEFTPYLLLSGVTSAILMPLQTYVSKKNEVV